MTKNLTDIIIYPDQWDSYIPMINYHSDQFQAVLVIIKMYPKQADIKPKQFKKQFFDSLFNSFQRAPTSDSGQSKLPFDHENAAMLLELDKYATKMSEEPFESEEKKITLMDRIDDLIKIFTKLEHNAIKTSTKDKFNKPNTSKSNDGTPKFSDGAVRTEWIKKAE